MNPALEALVRAYEAATLADNEHAPDAWRAFDALLAETPARHAHMGRNIKQDAAGNPNQMFRA